MSNENKDVVENQSVEEVKLIEISILEYERKVDIERAYLIHEGMNPEKARKKAAEIVAKKYVKVATPVDYSNWAGQRS